MTPQKQPDILDAFETNKLCTMGLPAPKCRGFLRRVNAGSSARPAYVGGNYNSNRNYGLFYFNANNSASNTNGNLGSRPLPVRNAQRTNQYRAGRSVALAKNSVD